MIINIDRQAILKSKEPEPNIIREAFDSLMKDNTPVNNVKFMKLFRTQDKSTMIENIDCLPKINTPSSSLMIKTLIETADLSDDILLALRENLYECFCSDPTSSNANNVSSVINHIDCKMKQHEDIKNIKSDLQFMIDCDRICPCCTTESYLADDIEVIMYNINESPEVIYDLEKIIRDIKMSNNTKYINSFPMMLNASTELVFFIRTPLTGDVLDLVTSLPTVIADKVIQYKLSKSQIKGFIRIYEKQIAKCYVELKNGAAVRYTILSTYTKKLINAKEKLIEYSKKSKDIINETIAAMQPEVAATDIEVVKNIECDLKDAVLDVIYDDDDDDDDTRLMESMSRLYTIAEQYQQVIEAGLSKGAVKRTQKIADVNRKVGTKIQGTINNASRKKVAIAKSFEPLVNSINKVVNSLKEKNKRDRTEQIMTGQYKFKLSRLIRTSIVTLATAGAGKTVVGAGLKVAASGIKGLATITNPLLLAIGILVGVAVDKSVDKKHRRSILTELESELTMVNEKLEDAKSNSDNEKKYQLMRIKMRLEKDIERIKYNLK